MYFCPSSALTISWNAQVNQITKKVNSGFTNLIRSRDVVDFRTLITIYLSIIQPHFQIWGCLGKGLSDKIQKLQNRAFRIINRENNETRTADVLNKFGFPGLKSTREYQLALLMIKINQTQEAAKLFNETFMIKIRDIANLISQIQNKYLHVQI